MNKNLFALLMLTIPLSAYAGLEPYETNRSDLWVEVSWCGKLQNILETSDGYWAIYEGISFESEVASRESCEKIAQLENPKQSGLFVVLLEKNAKVIVDSLRENKQSRCHWVSFIVSQIKNFVSHEGQELPLIIGASAWKCL